MRNYLTAFLLILLTLPLAGGGCADFMNFNTDLISLHDYTVDITDKIKRGEVKATLKRDHQVHKLADDLSAEQYNKVVIVGKTGAGKTSLVYHLAKEIHDGKIDDLKGMRVVQIDLAAIAQFASPLSISSGQYIELIDRAAKHYVGEYGNKVILFVDEIQIVAGAGFNHVEFGNLLKQLVDRMRQPMIMATTANEYAAMKVFHEDEALKRRLNVHTILETNLADTTEILVNLAPSFANQYGVAITQPNAALAAKLGIGIAYYASPATAINVINFACSRAQIRGAKVINDNDLYYAASMLSFLAVDTIKQAVATTALGKYDQIIDGRNDDTDKIVREGH